MMKEGTNSEAPQSPLRMIGAGEIGGKASGLLKVSDQLLSLDQAKSPFQIHIPGMIVLGTDIFDRFIAENQLGAVIDSELRYERLIYHFLNASLPSQNLGELWQLVRESHTPLAIRSSSLLEDQEDHPFAGVYYTKMIANNQPEAKQRFYTLRNAIKLVYASTFSPAARNYSRTLGIDHGREKMAVLIQKVAGYVKNKHFYPDISGVGRSLNYYPMRAEKAESGIVNLALGLGKTIVNGENCWIYSPDFPRRNPPYKSIPNMLKETQNRFWSVNMQPLDRSCPQEEDEFLEALPLKDAEYDDRIRLLASTYLPESDQIIPGIGRSGPRLITFSPLLQLDFLPLNDTIKNTMKICEEVYQSPVEIEFAVTLSPGKGQSHKFSLLQVRKIALQDDSVDLKSATQVSQKSIFIKSGNTLGHGKVHNIQHILFSKREAFDFLKTSQMVSEIEQMNHYTLCQSIPYLLVGFGRWGSTDPALGIPLEWGHISNVRGIVELRSEERCIDFSQGSHFFHNLFNLKVPYFSIDGRGGGDSIDWAWLESRETVRESEFFRLVKTARPLEIFVDGKIREGVIIR